MNIKTIAVIFGIVVLIAGILGFIPGITVDNKLLGLFLVDGIHNWVHILTGVAGLLAATKENLARLYFQIVGVVYALVTILGFLFNGDLFIMHVNLPDNLLHLVIALFALFFGFVYQRKRLTKNKDE